MTKAERTDLLKLARMRGNVAKRDVEARATEQLAEIEAQLARRYSAHHKAWEQITRRANKMVEEADAEIAAICRKMGVPESFRPEMYLGWWDRGENAEKKRREELRKAAAEQIASRVKAAKAAIERSVARILTELVADGLTTEQARAFLQSMPTIEQLFAPLQLPDIEQTRSRIEDRNKLLVE